MEKSTIRIIINSLPRISILLILLSASILNCTADEGQLVISDSLYIQEMKLATQKLNDQNSESLRLFEKAYESAIQVNDTASILKCLIGITDIERYRGNYNLAFDKLWNALLLAEAGGYTLEMVQIHRNLGILYNIYQKTPESIDQLQLSATKAKLIDNEIDRSAQIRMTYFSLSNVFRDKESYDTALIYLDSCSISAPGRILPFVDADKGFLYLKLGELSLAEDYLQKSYKYFDSGKDNYLATVYFYLGDLMTAKGSIDSAIFYYDLSFQIINTKNTYLEIKPEVLKQLANSFLKKSNYKKAYGYLENSLTVSDSLFNSKSKQNSQLFEIKNKYKESLEEKELLILEQKN